MKSFKPIAAPRLAKLIADEGVHLTGTRVLLMQVEGADHGISYKDDNDTRVFLYDDIRMNKTYMQVEQYHNHLPWGYWCMHYGTKDSSDLIAARSAAKLIKRFAQPPNHGQRISDDTLKELGFSFVPGSWDPVACPPHWVAHRKQGRPSGFMFDPGGHYSTSDWCLNMHGAGTEATLEYEGLDLIGDLMRDFDELNGPEL